MPAAASRGWPRFLWAIRSHAGFWRGVAGWVLLSDDASGAGRLLTAMAHGGGGTGTKVTFDTEGHIVSDEALVDTDIPDLPASKITSGTFDAARLGSKRLAAQRLPITPYRYLVKLNRLQSISVSFSLTR